jgi:hypothetical protein
MRTIRFCSLVAKWALIASAWRCKDKGKKDVCVAAVFANSLQSDL